MKMLEKCFKLILIPFLFLSSSCKNYGKPINKEAAEFVFWDILEKENSQDVDMNNCEFHFKNEKKYNSKQSRISYKKEVIREKDKIYYYEYDSSLQEQKEIEYCIYKNSNRYYFVNMINDEKKEITERSYQSYFLGHTYYLYMADYRSIIYGALIDAKDDSLFYTLGPGNLYGKWQQNRLEYKYEVEYENYFLKQFNISFESGKYNNVTFDYDNIKIDIPKL